MDPFSTIRYARSLGERRPDALPSACQVALLLATYADGRYGTSIRPGDTRIEDQTGLARSTVRRALKWLIDNGEIRRDKIGSRGSAACFTYLLPKQLGAHSERIGVRDEPPLTRPADQEPSAQEQKDQSGQPSVPTCPKHGKEQWKDDHGDWHCRRCDDLKYWMGYCGMSEDEAVTYLADAWQAEDARAPVDS